MREPLKDRVRLEHIVEASNNVARYIDGKSFEDIQNVEVQLKVVKPATSLNKEASLTVAVPGQTLFVEKTCDTFEESVDQCVDSMKVQLTKFKEKLRNR